MLIRISRRVLSASLSADFAMPAARSLFQLGRGVLLFKQLDRLQEANRLWLVNAASYEALLGRHAILDADERGAPSEDMARETPS